MWIGVWNYWYWQDMYCVLEDKHQIYHRVKWKERSIVCALKRRIWRKSEKGRSF